MKSTMHSPLEPTPRAKAFAGIVVIGYALISLIPLVWILMTSFRTPQDAIAYPPQVLTQPSLIGYVNLFTTRSRVGAQELAALPPPATWYEGLVREQQMILAGPSRFADRYLNSVLIGFGSTFLSVVLGTLAAYAFSRFRVPGKDDLLFFILSTRMMPPIAVAIPVYLMYRAVGLSDTHLGLILLYTVVNLSLAVWLLKGFMDEIPREYEEAAMVDGYTRFQAFVPGDRRRQRGQLLRADARAGGEEVDVADQRGLREHLRRVGDGILRRAEAGHQDPHQRDQRDQRVADHDDAGEGLGARRRVQRTVHCVFHRCFTRSRKRTVTSESP